MRIILRLSSETLTKLQRSAGHSLVADGTFRFPNYFDSQRFGSLGESCEFAAAAVCRRDYERAVWLSLADYSLHDRTDERRDKEFLQDHWRDWLLCKANIGRSNRRSVVTYLCDHPDKFRKAYALVDSNLRGLQLSAFQSAVWNKMLASVLSREDSTAPTIEIADSELPFAAVSLAVPEQLPLPSIRQKQISAEERRLCDSVLKAYDLELQTMKVSFPRDRWFSRARRLTSIVVKDIQLSIAADTMFRGSDAATIRFQLPAGAYATMLLRTLFAT